MPLERLVYVSAFPLLAKAVGIVILRLRGPNGVMLHVGLSEDLPTVG